MIEEFRKACRVGDVQLVSSYLCEDRSMLNVPDNSLGWTSLFRTVICGHLECTYQLLRHGADPNIQSKLGDTALHQACDSDSLEMVQMLLDFNADPNKQQSDGDTPLHYACRNGNKEIVLALLESSADPNVQNFLFGNTPGHVAAEKGYSELVQTLQQAAGYAEIDNFAGKTPRDLDSEPEEGEEVEFVGAISPPSFITKDSRSFEEYTDPYKLRKVPMNSLYSWLRRHKLEFLYGTLFSNGYDEIDTLIEAAQENLLTLKDLKKIGIDKPGHQRILLAYLSEQASKDDDPLSFSCCSTPKASIGFYFKTPLEEWLASVRLDGLYDQFLEAGYDNLEHLLFLMKGKFAINEEVLEKEIGIQKLGHRYRVMTKLKEATSSVNHCSLL